MFSSVVDKWVKEGPTAIICCVPNHRIKCKPCYFLKILFNIIIPNTVQSLEILQRTFYELMISVCIIRFSACNMSSPFLTALQNITEYQITTATSHRYVTASVSLARSGPRLACSSRAGRGRYIDRWQLWDEGRDAVRAILSPPNALSDRMVATPTSLPLALPSILSPSLFHHNTAFSRLYGHPCCTHKH